MLSNVVRYWAYIRGTIYSGGLYSGELIFGGGLYLEWGERLYMWWAYIRGGLIFGGLIVGGLRRFTVVVDVVLNHFVGFFFNN
jgi:hypothetical protein